LAAGAGLTGYAVYRMKLGGQPRSTEVAVTPTTTGGTVVIAGSW
jgi:hypothetical protein